MLTEDDRNLLAQFAEQCRARAHRPETIRSYASIVKRYLTYTNTHALARDRASAERYLASLAVQPESERTRRAALRLFFRETLRVPFG